MESTGVIEQYVRQAQTGDVQAFGRLVTKFQGLVHCSAYAVLGDFDLAEDVAQEAFIAAWRDLRSLRDPASFPAWLRRITYHRCCDQLRRREPVVPLDALEFVAGHSDAAALVEAKATVEQLLQSLTPPLRLVTVMFYLYEVPVSDIARLLALPTGTIKRRLYDARQTLRRRMGTMLTKAEGARRLSPAFAQAVLARVQYWERFGGSAEQRVAHVEADDEWRRLVEFELALGELSPAATAIRRQIACLESCHEHYVGNVQQILGMIGCMTPEQILDCGMACAARQQQAHICVEALQRWMAGEEPVAGSVDDRVYVLLGDMTPHKRDLVVHLARKLADSCYKVYLDADENLNSIEARIQHLDICNFNWEANLSIVLQEIAAGRRLAPWHGSDGFNAHGDCPNRLEELFPVLTGIANWLDGMPNGMYAHILGRRSAEKRWLVASLGKHVWEQHRHLPHAKALAHGLLANANWWPLEE